MKSFWSVVFIVLLSSSLPSTLVNAFEAYTMSRRCSSVDLPTVEDATELCASMGEFLATPQNVEQLETVIDANTGALPIVLGGILGASNSWKWIGGPFAGIIFYISGQNPYENINSVIDWKSSGALMAGNMGSRVTVYDGSKWNTMSTTSTLDGYKCAMCQKYTGCTAVCNPKGTASFTGGSVSWESCVCVCKAGYTGPYCSYQTSLHCHATPVSDTEASAACEGRGGFVASPSSLEIMMELWAQYNSTNADTQYVLDGTDEVLEGTWRWTKGPDAGKAFWSGQAGGFPLNGFKTFWLSGEPNNYAGYEDTLCMRSFKWNDCNISYPAPLQCYACQFTQCNTSYHPCSVLHTISASGGYENCECVCEAGFGGRMCDQTTTASMSVTHSLHSASISQYTSSHTLHSPTSSLSHRVPSNSHTSSYLGTMTSSTTPTILTTSSASNTPSSALSDTPPSSKTTTVVSSSTIAISSSFTGSHSAPSLSSSPQWTPTTTHSNSNTIPLTTSLQAIDITKSHHRSRTSSTTQQPQSPPPPQGVVCNHSCADVLSKTLIQDATTPPPSSTQTGSRDNSECTPIVISYKEAVSSSGGALVLMHLKSIVVLNPNFDFMTTPLTTEPIGSTITASVIAVNTSSNTIVIKVGRSGPSMDKVVGRIALPAPALMCTNDNKNIPMFIVQLTASIPALSVAEQQTIATISAVAPSLQTVAAVGLLRCSPGSVETSETDAGVRALVPIALTGTCAGAVQGALLGVASAGVISIIATAVLMRVRGISWMNAAAVTRCPGAMLGVCGFMQMGLVVCGSRLILLSSDATDTALGIIGVGLGATLPLVNICLAWGVISRRCYRIGLTQTARKESTRGGIWLRSVLLPEFELDTSTLPVSKAYSTLVGRSRLVGSVWAAVPVSQPLIMMVVVFVHGAGCSAVLIVAAVCMLLVAGVCHVWFRPHRILVSNYLQSCSMTLNGGMLLAGSKLTTDPQNPSALAATQYIAMAQVALSCVRLCHSVGAFLYMHRFRQASYMLVEPDGHEAVLENPLLPQPPTVDATNYPTFVFEYLVGSARRIKLHEEVNTPVVLPMLPILPISTTPTVQSQLSENRAQALSKPIATQRCEKLVKRPRNTEQLRTTTASTLKQQSPKKLQPSFFAATSKNTRPFHGDIVSTVLNNHRGYVPMELPYTVYWEEEEGQHQRTSIDSDDEELELHTTTTDTSDRHGSSYEISSDDGHGSSESSSTSRREVVGKNNTTNQLNDDDDSNCDDGGVDSNATHLMDIL